MKTIEKIKKMTHKDDFRIFVKSLNLSKDDYKAMMEYIDEISAARPEAHWIPCSERLPKVGERVLAQQINGTMQVMKCIDGGHLKWFYSRTVAWMPLPEPYQGGEKK